MAEKKHYRLNTNTTPFHTPNPFPPPASEYPVTEALKDQSPKDHCVDCKVELTLENEMVRSGVLSQYCKKCWETMPF